MMTYLSQAAADAGNMLQITMGAGAVTALGGAVVLIVKALKAKMQRAKVTLQEPVPEVPVTMTRKYNPPTFSQHMDAVRRIDRLEHCVDEIRREAAKNYTELMNAGEARTNRMLDKLDDVARAFHSRVDDLIANRPPNRKAQPPKH
jgi:hypothetical protein